MGASAERRTEARRDESEQTMNEQTTSANANGVGQATSEAPLPPVTGYALVGERTGVDGKTQTIRSPVSEDKWYERLATPEHMLNQMRLNHPTWTWKVIHKAHNK